MKEKIRFFLEIVLISIVSLIQSLSPAVFNGIKPNFVLAVLVVFIFAERSFARYLVLVLTSLIFLNYSVFISKELAAFGALMLSAFYFKRYLSENIFIFSFLSASILTALLYLLIDPGFIFNNFNLFFSELFYNVIISLIFGSVYQYEHE